jgi:hypothetical protein
VWSGLWGHWWTHRFSWTIQVKWKTKFQLTHTSDWNLPLQRKGWNLILRKSSAGIASSLFIEYNIVTLPVCRIGQRWGATRAAYRIQNEQCLMALLFFIAHSETQGDKPRGQGAEPLGV